MTSKSQPNLPQTRIIKLYENDSLSNIYATRITITTDRKIRVFETNRIKCFQSDKNYTYIHLKSDERILTSKTLKRFEDKIDPHQFLRIHNSYIINVDEIDNFDTYDNKLELKDGSILPVARSRKSILKQYLKKFML